MEGMQNIVYAGQQKKAMESARQHPKWRRYGTLHPRTEPLSGGEDIMAKQIQLTLEEYGRVHKIPREVIFDD